MNEHSCFACMCMKVHDFKNVLHSVVSCGSCSQWEALDSEVGHTFPTSVSKVDEAEVSFITSRKARSQGPGSGVEDIVMSSTK